MKFVVLVFSSFILASLTGLYFSESPFPFIKKLFGIGDDHHGVLVSEGGEEGVS